MAARIRPVRHRDHALLSLLFLIGIFASACGGGATGDVDVSVDMSALTSADIGSVSVTVTGPGMADMQTDLVLVGSTWQGTLGGIPVGDNRVFSGLANDSGGNPIFSGQSAPVAITAGQTALVVLELTPTMPPPSFGNHAPHIDSLYLSAQTIAPGDTIQIAATASDLDGDPLTFAWTGNGAFGSPATGATSWTAPPADGAYPLTITVTDPYGALDAVTVTIQVAEANAHGAADINATFNSFPQVADVTLSTGHLQIGQPATATATAFDADGDALTYAWSDDCGGTWTGAGAAAQITLPAGSTATSCTLRVDVDDGHGGANFGTLVVAVGGDPTTTFAPVFDTTFESTSVAANAGQVVLRVTAHPVMDGVNVVFNWSATAGVVTGATNQPGTESDVTWQAPDCFLGSADITVSVTDAVRATASYTFTVTADASDAGCVPDGLVSWWTADGTTADAVGGRDAIANAAGFTYEPGVHGEAFAFHVTGQGLHAPSAGLPAGSDERTIEMWVRVDQTAPVGGQDLYVAYGAVGQLDAACALGGSLEEAFFSQWGEAIAGGTIAAGTGWHHVAVTTVLDTATLYVDGTVTASGSLPISTITGPGDDVIFGFTSIGSVHTLDGAIDDIRIYDRARSTAEIATLAAAH